MEEIVSTAKKEAGEKKYTSLQRSTDIFVRLTNLSMEWNMYCFVGSFLSSSEKEKYWDEMHQKMAQSILDNIKTLKGCWVKLGQFLSTKSGFLPRYYLDAFAQLQDYMPNSDFSEIIDTIQDDLGFMDDIYSNFDSIPIASASIAQVHKAKLSDGSTVAVKVQHKSSEQNLMNDIEILKMITSMMQSAGIYPDIRDYFDEYASYAAKELDFTVETNNIQYSHVDVVLSKAPVKVPRLYMEYCSRHVITMEFYELNKFTDVEFLERHKVNLPQVIYDLHDFAFFQIMSCGRFHSDPHPGNLQLNYDPKDKKIYPVFLDWGFTTHVDDISRIGLCKMYKSVYTYDVIGVISAMIESGFTLLDKYPYRYDSLFDAFIGILLSSHKLSFGSAYDKKSDNVDDDLRKSREAQARVQKLTQEFIMQYFRKAPNFVPLSFKVLSEYQSLSKTVRTYAPFLHLIYKNASYSLYSIYNSPLNTYYAELKQEVLQNKLNAIRTKINREPVAGVSAKMRRYSFYDMVEKMTFDSLKRNKNFRIFSELMFAESKNLLESRLADLLRYLNQDNSNVIAFQAAVIHNGCIDVELSFGNIDKYELRPISNETLFPLFTISSGILAVAVLHLASIGKIGLDDRIHIYWPEFKPNKECVTIRDVLEHKCGVIYSDFPFFDLFTSREMMLTCVETSQFFYHNTGVDYMFNFYGFILSEIITRVTKVPAEEFVLMLTSMIGIDNSNFLYPNPVPSGTETPADSSEDEDYSSSDDIEDFTRNLNQLFEQSVTVFGAKLPLLQFLNLEKAGPKSDEEEEDERKGSKEFRYEDSDSSDDEKSKSIKANKKSSIGTIGPGPRATADGIRIVSLDGDGLDSRFRNVNLDIDEFRKNLAFQSTVIEVPKDEHGQSDSTYFCYCYKYDKDFPDDEIKRCYVPTKYCPTVNRLVKLFRGNSEDSVFPKYSSLMEDEPEKLPGGNLDPDFCSIIQKERADSDSDGTLINTIRESLRRKFSTFYNEGENVESNLNSDADEGSDGTLINTIRESFHRKFSTFYNEGENVESNLNSDADEVSEKGDSAKPQKPKVIGTMGKVLKVRNKVCFNESNLVKLEGFTLADLFRFKSTFLDPIISNYPKFYLNSIPFLNARSNALSLALFYYSVLSGSLISSDILGEVMSNSGLDNSLLSRIFIGMYKPMFSLGFQKFAFLGRDEKVYEGFGHSDISGSVVMGIPELKLAITVFTSHCTRQYVMIKVLSFILEHYGLRLLGYNLLDSNFYKVLTML